MKQFLVFIFCLLSLQSVTACDICGCSTSGGAFSVLPLQNKNLVGLRWSFREFNSSHPPSINLDAQNEKSHELFNTIELAGVFNLAKRVRMSVMVPVNISYQNSTVSGVVKHAGIGDITVYGQYLFVNPDKCTLSKIKHQFTLGAGFKLPTGKSNLNVDNSLLPQNLQPGTGSFDVLLGAGYTMRVNSFGWHTELNYKINTTNQQQYKFGDKIRASTRFFYLHNATKKLSINYSVGAEFENAFINVSRNMDVPHTGGKFLNAVAGIDLYVKPFAISLNYRPLIYQHFSDGYVKGKNFFDASIFYIF